MGKFFYTIYALIVIVVMSNVSYSKSSPQFASSKVNSYYPGGSSGGYGSYSKSSSKSASSNANSYYHGKSSGGYNSYGGGHK
jgi:hypothetical protein